MRPLAFLPEELSRNGQDNAFDMIAYGGTEDDGHGGENDGTHGHSGISGDPSREGRKHPRSEDDLSTSGSSSDLNQDGQMAYKKMMSYTMPTVGRPKSIPDIAGFPDHYLEAFNNSDADKIQELTIRMAVPDCAFQGWWMPQELIGRLHFVEFSKYVMNKSPDMVMVIKNTKLETRSSLKFRFYISWTGTSLSFGTSNNSIYSPPIRKTILEEMDLSKKSEGEMKALAEREKYQQKAQQRVRVYGRGDMCLFLNRQNLVKKFHVSNFNILSFDELSEASISSL